MKRRRFVGSGLLVATGMMAGGFSFSENLAMGRKNYRNYGATDSFMDEVRSYRKIDAHAHVGMGSIDYGDSVLFHADKLGIDKLMISRPISDNSKATPENFREVNDFIVECVKRHRDRFVGGVCFNAKYQKESLEEIDRCLDAGMVGTGELYRQIKINDPKYYPIIEKFIDRKMVIMQHTVVGYSRVKWWSAEPKTSSLPEDFVDIARRYPEGMFQYAHIGGGIDWENSCKVLKDSPNVFVDVSGSNGAANMMDFAMKHIGEDRLLFACDNSYYQSVGRVFSAGLTKSQLEKIFFDNYNNILKKSGNQFD